MGDGVKVPEIIFFLIIDPFLLKYGLFWTISFASLIERAGMGDFFCLRTALHFAVFLWSFVAMNDHTLHTRPPHTHRPTVDTQQPALLGEHQVPVLPLLPRTGCKGREQSSAQGFAVPRGAGGSGSSANSPKLAVVEFCLQKS